MRAPGRAPATHHRLLEGVLLRLARSPHADQFILRGGMLLRHWFRPLPRFASDLDLVATFDFDVEESARRFIPLLRDDGVEDGVEFDGERFRVEGIWQNTDFPGVRIFACGAIDGHEEAFSVDVTFGEPLVPAPVAGEYRMTGTDLSATLWMCRPETITGRKLHALFHMGRLHWRPKDLNDLRLLLGRVPMDAEALPEAISASFASRGNTSAEARGLFQRDTWSLKRSSARWQDFVRANPAQQVPRDLAAVVADVSAQLFPILERLP